MGKINPIVEHNRTKRNKTGGVTVLTVGQAFVCPSDGFVRAGGYGAGATAIDVNNLRLRVILHGNQAFAAIFDCVDVYAGDVVTISYISGGSTGEGVTNVAEYYKYKSV